MTQPEPSSVIYLDHASTSYPKPPEVHQAVTACIEEAVNPGRGAYRLAARSSQWLDQTRAALASFFGLGTPEQVIFALNCTDALNMALKGLLQEGDRVLSTGLEHNAVARPLHSLAAHKQLEVEWLPPDASGHVDPAAYEKALQEGPVKLIVLTHASNVTGAIQPIEAIGALARRYDALLLVDAAQTAGVVPIHMEEMMIDALAWPGHKGLYGHMGIGGLCLGARFPTLEAWREGGTGTDSLSLAHPTEGPSHLEAGTHNLLGIASVYGGLQHLKTYEEGAILRHQQHLRQHMVTHLTKLGLPCFGVGEEGRYVGTLSFNVPGLDPHLVSSMLDASFGIATRAGLHCAPLAHESLKTSPTGTVRVSVGGQTTFDEVNSFCDAIKQLCAHLSPDTMSST